MTAPKVNPNNFYMEVVSRDSTSIFSALSCGNTEIDKYFHEKAADDSQNVFYAYRNSENGDIIGVAALNCSGININSHNLIELIPAIKIDYFAVSEKYQDIKITDSFDPAERYYVSDDFLGALLREIHDISEKYVGATHVILYSVPDAVHFYERNLFQCFEEYMKPEQYRYLDGCKPMYMVL